METLFGIPTARLAAGLATATCALLLALVVLAVRRRTLFRMGVRNAARRPIRGVVIVAGLMLSSVVISTAFATGDAMTWTVRSLVTGNIGSVDEVITAPQRDFTQISSRNIDSLASGSLSVAPSGSFLEGELARLRDGTSGSSAIAGLLPAYLLQAPVAGAAEQLVHPGVGVLGLPQETAGPFQLRDAGGAALTPGDLGGDGAYLNGAAAGLLGVSAGRSVRVFLPSAAARQGELGEEHDFTVRGIVSNGSIVGPAPTVFLSLPALQAALGQPGRLNEIMVINHCGDSTACSERATLELRRLLVDPVAAETLRNALARSSGRSVLRAIEGRRQGRGRDQVADLARTVAKGHVSDHLLYLLGDPQVAGTLQATAGFLPTSDGRAFRTLRTLNRLTVVEVKQSALQEASDYGSVLTSVFLVLGLFSIAASLLLVFLVFVMLAAERRSELGIARAIGLRRSHLVQSFTFEGVVYDLAAAALGALAGIGVSAAIVWLVAHALRRYGIPVQRHVEPRSALIAFCLGVLVTFVTVLCSAWRVSRLNIVEAIRGIAFEPPLGPGIAHTLQRRMTGLTFEGPAGAARVLRRIARLAGGVVALPAALLWALTVRGLTVVPLGLALIQAGRGRHQYVLFALGATLGIVGLALVLRWLLLLVRLPQAGAERLVSSLAGGGVTLFWALPAGTWHVGGTRIAIGSVETFALAGVMMVLGTVWLVAYNVAGPLRTLVGVLGRGGAVTAALRMAVAYPLQHRFRTGMAVAMFSLVVFTMVVSAVLLDSAQKAYVARERPPTGYDISATAPREANLTDLSGALSGAPASSPDEFAGVGSIVAASAQTLDTAAHSASWSDLSVRLADAGAIAGTRLRLSARARGYATDDAVWSAMLNTPGTAVASRTGLSRLAGGAAALSNLSYDQRSFDPFAVWVRSSDGPPVRLIVIGVADDSDVLPSGLLTLASNLPALSAANPVPTTFLFKTRDGRDPSQAATGLELSFGLKGLQVSVVGEGLRNVQTMRRLLNYLLEGFVGLGLVSGMAALGVISTRTVVERRQEIGMLRAIGLRRRLVQWSFLLEVSLIAWLGVAVGSVLALLLARNVVTFLSGSFQELTLSVPWGEVALIALIAYVAALLTTLSAAWQAGHVAPAEALRYE